MTIIFFKYFVGSEFSKSELFSFCTLHMVLVRKSASATARTNSDEHTSLLGYLNVTKMQCIDAQKVEEKKG